MKYSEFDYPQFVRYQGDVVKLLGITKEGRGSDCYILNSQLELVKLPKAEIAQMELLAGCKAFPGSLTVEELREAISDHQLDGLVLTGVSFLEPKKLKVTVSGNECIEYEPAATGLKVTSGEAVIATLDGVAHGDYFLLSSAIEDAASLRRPDVKVAHSYSKLFLLNKQPDKQGELAIPVMVLLDAFRLEREFISLCGTNNPGRLADNRFEFFCLHGCHKGNPPGRELYDRLLALRKEIDWTHISMIDFYSGYKSSLKNMVDEVTFTAEFVEKARRCVTSWKEQSDDEIHYWLCRNLDVHPAFREAAAKLVSQLRGEPGLAAANADGATS